MRDIDWEAAINTRRSVRSYGMKPVEPAKVELLQSFIARMPVPFVHNVNIRLFKANPNKKLFTVFTSPPDGAAFLAPTDICSISRAGFVGEMFILYATGLGLGTCWYGHYVPAELERIMPHLGEYKAAVLSGSVKYGYGTGEVPGERAICITPLGYWQQEGLRLMDRMQTSLFSFKRKPVGALLEEGVSEASLPSEILYAFDLARKAPSAANSQFWRFGVSADNKTFSIARPVGHKHFKWEHPDVEIGICACHFWLGLRLKNVACRVSLREEQGRAVWQFAL
ncbi:MAG: nitroreductase family protein [bacterium]